MSYPTFLNLALLGLLGSAIYAGNFYDLGIAQQIVENAANGVKINGLPQVGR